MPKIIQAINRERPYKAEKKVVSFLQKRRVQVMSGGWRRGRDAGGNLP